MISANILFASRVEHKVAPLDIFPFISVKYINQRIIIQMIL